MQRLCAITTQNRFLLRKVRVDNGLAFPSVVKFTCRAAEPDPWRSLKDPGGRSRFWCICCSGVEDVVRLPEFVKGCLIGSPAGLDPLQRDLVTILKQRIHAARWLAKSNTT